VQNQAFYRTGNFSLAGGILLFQNGNSRWPWSLGACTSDTSDSGANVSIQAYIHVISPDRQQDTVDR